MEPIMNQVLVTAVIFSLPIVIAILVFTLIISKKLNQYKSQTDMLLIRLEERDRVLKDLRENLINLLSEQKKEHIEQRSSFDQHQLNSLNILQESLQANMGHIRKQITETLSNHTD